MLNIPHIDASSVYAALGFDNALRTAITLSFITYCTVFFTFCIFTIVAFGEWIPTPRVLNYYSLNVL